MNEPSSPELSQEIPGQRIAVRLGVLLLAALALALGLAMRDNARRAQLEVVVESSPLNDTHYLTIPDPPPPEPLPAVANLRGQPLVPESYQLREKREVNLQPVAKDETTGLSIYQEPGKANDADEPPRFYLKVAPGKYLRVRPAKATK